MNLCTTTLLNVSGIVSWNNRILLAHYGTYLINLIFPVLFCPQIMLRGAADILGNIPRTSAARSLPASSSRVKDAVLF
jgi:hypothetical protein